MEHFGTTAEKSWSNQRYCHEKCSLFQRETLSTVTSISNIIQSVFKALFSKEKCYGESTKDQGVRIESPKAFFLFLVSEITKEYFWLKYKKDKNFWGGKKKKTDFFFFFFFFVLLNVFPAAFSPSSSSSSSSVLHFICTPNNSTQLIYTPWCVFLNHCHFLFLTVY